MVSHRTQDARRTQQGHVTGLRALLIPCARRAAPGLQPGHASAPAAAAPMLRPVTTCLCAGYPTDFF